MVCSLELGSSDEFTITASIGRHKRGYGQYNGRQLYKSNSYKCLQDLEGVNKIPFFRIYICETSTETAYCLTTRDTFWDKMYIQQKQDCINHETFLQMFVRSKTEYENKCWRKNLQKMSSKTGVQSILLLQK